MIDNVNTLEDYKNIGGLIEISRNKNLEVYHKNTNSFIMARRCGITLISESSPSLGSDSSESDSNTQYDVNCYVCIRL
jgi:hypothetical protein